MSVATLISDFQEQTGRYDLDTAAVLRFINRGQRYLDVKTERALQAGAVTLELIPGGSIAVGPAARRITAVYLNDNDQRTELTRITSKELRALYTKLPSGQVSTSRPTLYAHASFREIPAHVTSDTVDQYTGFMDVVPKAHEYSGVMLWPYSDASYIIELHGCFFDPPVEDREDNDSYWLAQHEDMLLIAARRTHEGSMRNSAGLADIDAELRPYIDSAYADFIDDDDGWIERMEG